MIREITDNNEWMGVLNRMENYDCYHTFEYHQITKKKGQKAFLLVYENGIETIALPVLFQSIPGSEFFDCNSVYGYPGPVFTKGIVPADISKFQEALQAYFENKKIVSVFSRLNPYISNQEKILEGLGTVEELGDVVNIDLTKHTDEQRQAFSKTTKRYLNKARRLCYVKKSDEPEDIEAFVKLYYENMDRVNAKESYYFNKDYFFDLAMAKSFKAEVMFAILKDTNEIISAAMAFKTNNIVQYHVSGTKNDYLSVTPIRLLLDEFRMESTEERYTYFNLGGGLGSESDSLFYFKSSFSKDFKKFNVWKHIVLPDIYDKLTPENSKGNKEVNFFPMYRHK